MLHIIKTVAAVADAVRYAGDSDTLLLTESAVYAANPQHKEYPQLSGLALAVLEPDAIARGIANRIAPSAQQVDYAGFVSLTAQHQKSVTWE